MISKRSIVRCPLAYKPSSNAYKTWKIINIIKSETYKYKAKLIITKFQITTNILPFVHRLSDTRKANNDNYSGLSSLMSIKSY